MIFQTVERFELNETLCIYNNLAKGNEMSRRIIEISTPIGNIQNKTIEHFLTEQAKLNSKWELLENKTASQFLRKGWPMNSKTFIWNSFDNKELDLSTYHETEFSKYGQCHVLKNLPLQKQEGVGLKLLLNIMQNSYPVSEVKITDNMIKGVTSGVKIFVDDEKSNYIDHSYATDIPVGSFASLQLGKKIDHFLPPPHGICNRTVQFSSYSQCFTDWYLKEFEKICKWSC